MKCFQLPLQIPVVQLFPCRPLWVNADLPLINPLTLIKVGFLAKKRFFGQNSVPRPRIWMKIGVSKSVVVWGVVLGVWGVVLGVLGEVLAVLGVVLRQCSEQCSEPTQQRSYKDFIKAFKGAQRQCSEKSVRNRPCSEQCSQPTQLITLFWPFGSVVWSH